MRIFTNELLCEETYEEDTLFRLQLTGDQLWIIRGTEEQSAIVQELARLMRLQPTGVPVHSATNLIFTHRHAECPPSLNSAEDNEVVYEDQVIRICWRSEAQDVICEVQQDESGNGIYKTMRMAVQMVHHLNVIRGGLPFHAALVERDGCGVLLTARGGTGKTTCCHRLPDSWTVWCDDETLVAWEASQGYRVHPFPTWSQYIEGDGSLTWNTEGGVPLRAICFLEQAETDAILPLTTSAAGIGMYHSVYPVYQRFWKKSGHGDTQTLNTRLFSNACDMALTIPAYILRVSLQGWFWEEIEGMLDMAKVR
jgi:SynChlorMet cassette protein ScmC